VTVTVEGGFEPAAQATLFARAGGTESYQSVALQPDGGADGTVTLTGTVPAALATPAGIDYYLVLSDGSETVAVPGRAPAAAARAPRHLPVAFDGLSAEGAFAPQTYRMVSLPVQPDGQSLKEALRAHYGAYDPQTWRLLRWDAAAETYREFPELDTLRPGDGAWLVTEAGSTLAVPAGRTVDAGTPYRIPLQEGWNQVGVPFGFSVPWEEVKAATDIAPANLDGPVAYRDTSDEGPAAPAYRYAQSTLRPWRAYFVYNGTGGPDTLVVPPGGGDADAPAAATRLAAHPAAAADSGHYTMRIAAQADGGALRDGQTWIGFRPDARRGRDRHDMAKAPPVRVPYLQVQARAGPAADGRPHAASYQPFGGTGGAWTLTVRARLDDPDATTTVHLHLRDVGARPPDARRYVLDPEQGRRLAIQNDRVAVEVQSGEPRRLRVLVGTEAFAEAKSGDISLQSFTTGLSGNYPNPFARETRIEYQLADRRRVTLAVFNVLGQRVRTLVDEPQDAGGHAVTWEGENRYGRPVGSGVYFVRLTAGSTTKTRKMVLVR
jgi:hypothetical protein